MVIDAPTLYETQHLLKICAAVVVVACSPENQLARLMKRDSITEEEAKARIKSQIPLGVKIKKADHVFWNDADLETCNEDIHRELIPLLDVLYANTKWMFFSFLGIIGILSMLVCLFFIFYGSTSAFLVALFRNQGLNRE